MVHTPLPSGELFIPSSFLSSPRGVTVMDTWGLSTTHSPFVGSKTSCPDRSCCVQQSQVTPTRDPSRHLDFDFVCGLWTFSMSKFLTDSNRVRSSFWLEFCCVERVFPVITRCGRDEIVRVRSWPRPTWVSKLPDPITDSFFVGPSSLV